MHKNILFFLFLLVAAGVSQVRAQDLIIRNNGDTIRCFITSEDSAAIHFSMTVEGRDGFGKTVKTFVKRSEVKSVTKEIIVRKYYKPDTSTIGFGIGFDYGGIGMSFLTYPHKNIGLFIGAGYALAGFGINGGVKLRLLYDSTESILVLPFIATMYGYNTAIYVENGETFNKLFYGYTAALGMDFRFKPQSQNYFSFSITFPRRDGKADAYIQELKDKHGVEFKNQLSIVGVSLGLKMIVK
jgi:hypothetical protein